MSRCREASLCRGTPASPASLRAWAWVWVRFVGAAPRGRCGPKDPRVAGRSPPETGVVVRSSPPRCTMRSPAARAASGRVAPPPDSRPDAFGPRWARTAASFRSRGSPGRAPAMLTEQRFHGQLTIGDGVGHDVMAAVAMGHLRGLLRACAWAAAASPDAAAVLERVDELLVGLDITTMATLADARLVPDPAGGWIMTRSNAGHPPLLLRLPDGVVEFLDGGTHDLLLGVQTGGGRTTSRHHLQRGSMVLAYTDGLVERRGEVLTAGWTGSPLRWRRAPVTRTSCAGGCWTGWGRRTTTSPSWRWRCEGPLRPALPRRMSAGHRPGCAEGHAPVHSRGEAGAGTSTTAEASATSAQTVVGGRRPRNRPALSWRRPAHPARDHRPRSRVPVVGHVLQRVRRRQQAGTCAAVSGRLHGGQRVERLGSRRMTAVLGRRRCTGDSWRHTVLGWFRSGSARARP